MNDDIFADIDDAFTLHVNSKKKNMHNQLSPKIRFFKRLTNYIAFIYQIGKI